MKQLEFIRKGMGVKRFHTIATIQANTVAHHSCGVALLCMLLSEEPSYDLLKAALLHDMAEHITGDVPADAARAIGVRDLFAFAESHELVEAGLALPGLSAKEQRVLKLADAIDGALFCITERAMGNKHLTQCYANYTDYILALEPKEGVEMDICTYIGQEWRKADEC